MSNVRGGDITQLLADGREYDVPSESNVNFRLSGWKNESVPTGNGAMVTRRTRKLGGFDSLPLLIDPDKEDLEYLQEKADSGEPVSFQMSLATGHTYSGDLVIQGEVDSNTREGQTEISALGPKFEQI